MHYQATHEARFAEPADWLPSAIAALRPWLLLAACAVVGMFHALPFILRPRYDVVGCYTMASLGLVLTGIVVVRVFSAWQRCRSDRGWWAYVGLVVTSPIWIPCIVEGLYLLVTA